MLSPRAADPFGTKAVRAAWAPCSRVPVARATWDEVRAALGRTGGRSRWCRARARRCGGSLARRPALFVLGAERAGLPAELVAACDESRARAARPGGAESLNVAMTATLCLYEAALHRLSPDHG